MPFAKSAFYSGDGATLGSWKCSIQTYDNTIRARKTHTNINKYGDCPQTGWVANICLCAFLGVIPFGGENTETKSTENPGTNPGRYLYTSCFLQCLFRSQWKHCTQFVKHNECPQLAHGLVLAQLWRPPCGILLCLQGCKLCLDAKMDNASTLKVGLRGKMMLTEIAVKWGVSFWFPLFSAKCPLLLGKIKIKKHQAEIVKGGFS